MYDKGREWARGGLFDLHCCDLMKLPSLDSQVCTAAYSPQPSYDLHSDALRCVLLRLGFAFHDRLDYVAFCYDSISPFTTDRLRFYIDTYHERPPPAHFCSF